MRWAPDAVRAMDVGDTACPANAQPGLRQRIVTAAASQWQAFGYPIVDWTANPSTLVPSDRGAPIIPEQLNRLLSAEHRQRMAPRLGLMEDDPEAMLAIGAYWAVTAPREIERQNRLWAIEPATGWAVPWSAAFVSWVMCEAGLTEQEFPRSSAHIVYIDHAYRSGESGAAAYRYQAMGDGPIEAGDLICSWRGTREPLDFETGRQRIDEANDFRGLSPSEQERRLERGAVTGPVGTHCDMVVRVDEGRRRVYAIGGNVLQAVTMTIVGYTGEREHVAIEAPPTFPGARQWFAVLRLARADAGDASLDAALRTQQ